jgi:2-iminobutanoate/2-iminopropanoate deaminase
MTHTPYDVGVAGQIGSYSDAVEIGANHRRLVTSGTPGLATTGELPQDVSAQADLAWQHIIRMLERAGMTLTDIVKVTQYLTRAADIAAYTKIRKRLLGDTKPASMLLIVPQLVRPDSYVEIEILAAKNACT